MRQFTVSLILTAFVLHNVSGQIDTDVELDLWNTTDSICHTLERNRIMMREVTERDEFAAKNALLKREITNLEFSNSKCNDKLFKKDEIILKLRSVNSIGDEQTDQMTKERDKLRRKLKRRNFMLYVAGGVAVFGVVYGSVK